MEFYLGQIIIFGGNFAIRGLAFAHGQLLPISQNTALFSLYGTMYGGDGRTTFALPDLRGRAPIGHGHGPGLSSVDIGERRGQETTTLMTQNLPAHSHGMYLGGGAGTVGTGAGNYIANASFGETIYTSTAPSGDQLGTSIGNTGNGVAFSNLSPELGLTYQVALQGIFPSRS